MLDAGYKDAEHPVSWFGNFDDLEKLVYDMKTVYTVCFSVEAGQDPVSEDGLGYGSNVLARYVIASIHDRSGFCTQDKVLRCPGASSPAYPALNGIGACTIVWPCTPHQLHCIPYHVLCSGYFSDDLLKPENISAGHNRV